MKTPVMTLYDLPAPAKLNLFLHVIGRREDGYHLLQSLFRLVSLSDSISIDLRRDGQISREGDLQAMVEAGSDLTMRAAEALRRACGVRSGAHIKVVKRIPAGAGLGGGSSDAATVLLALNRLWRTNLDRQQLMAVGLSIGADVPFFIHGQAGFVEGVGERITAVQAPEQSYILFKPAVAIPTAVVFGDPDLTRDSERVKIADFSGCIKFVGSTSGLISEKSVATKDWRSSGSQEKTGFGSNDLEAVVLRKFVEVGQVKYWLSSLGIDTRLSGSGSCLFAEADNPEKAMLASEELLAKMRAVRKSSSFEPDVPLESIHICDGLQVHPLRDWVNDPLGSRQVG